MGCSVALNVVGCAFAPPVVVPALPPAPAIPLPLAPPAPASDSAVLGFPDKLAPAVLAALLVPVTLSTPSNLLSVSSYITLGSAALPDFLSLARRSFSA